MINLIPDTIRINNRYAQRNTYLLRYTFVAALTMAVIGAITGISIIGMQHTQNILQQQINAQSQKMVSYTPLTAKASQLSDELTTINSLLTNQVQFSKLLPQIANVMPAGAVLKGLDISTSEILPSSSTPGGAASSSSSSASQQTPFVIQAAVKDPNVAATLLENIKNAKNLFTDADIVTINQSTSSSTDANSLPSVNTRYPYQVTINAYLKTINTKKTVKGVAG